MITHSGFFEKCAQYKYLLLDDQGHPLHGNSNYNCVHMAGGLHKHANKRSGLCPCDKAFSLYVHNLEAQPLLPLHICISQRQCNSTDAMCVHTVMFLTQVFCNLHSLQSIISSICAGVHNALVPWKQSKL